MILNCYSIFDSKALTYAPPFYAATNGSATRIVMDAAADPNTSLGRHPADFIVYRVGTFDDSNGFFTRVEPREHVVDVISLVQLKQLNLLREPAEA